MPDEAGKRSLRALLPLYRRITEERWNAQVSRVQETELGTARAIAHAFSSKKVSLPELPTFEAMLRSKLPAEARMPEWMRKFEEANRQPD